MERAQFELCRSHECSLLAPPTAKHVDPLTPDRPTREQERPYHNSAGDSDAASCPPTSCAETTSADATRNSRCRTLQGIRQEGG
jgi:hypothetical protein